jgi:hypothetical protein
MLLVYCGIMVQASRPRHLQGETFMLRFKGLPFVKKFLITKTITAELEVECGNELEALAWAETIVATLENEDGQPVELAPNMEFTAHSAPSQCSVELLMNIET